MNRFESLLTAACIAGSLCVASVATAQQPAAPPKGNAVLATTTVTATVAKIDQKTRAVTLKAANGQEYSFVADEAVKNLAQVKKGDVVTATYTEALAYEVKKGGSRRGGRDRRRRHGKARREAGGRPRANNHGGRRSHQDRREGSVGNLQGSKRRNTHGQGPGTGETRGRECR